MDRLMAGIGSLSPKPRLLQLRPLKGLTARIIAWSLAPTTIILSIVALFVLHTYQQVTEDLVAERNQALTSLLAGQVSVEMTRYADLLDNLAANPDIQSFVFPVQQTTLRGAMGVLHMFDGGVLVLDEDGQVAAADPRCQDLIGHDWSNTSIYRQLAFLQTNQFVSDVEWVGAQAMPMIAIAMPIRPARQPFLGLVVGLFRLDQENPNAFYRSLIKFHVRGSRIYFVDSHGHLIDFAQRLRSGEDISSEPVIQAALTGQIGAMRIQNQAGQAIIASYAPVPDTPLRVIEEESWTELTETVGQYGQLLLLLLLLGLVMPSLVVIVGIRHITQPLQALTGAATAMAQGELRQEIQVASTDEVGRLAAAFNHMSAQLLELYEEMERKVQHRTRELATLNTIAGVVSQSLELEEVLQGALQETLTALGMESGAAYRLEPETARLSLVTQMGTTPELLAALDDFCPAGRVWAQPGAAPAIQPLALCPADPNKEKLQRAGWQTVVRVPLVARDQTLGLMLLGGAHPGAEEAERLSLLGAIGQQVGVAMENAQLYERAEEDAATAERQRLAHDLHDSVTQTLFSANLIAGVLPLLWKEDPAVGEAQLAVLQRLTQGALSEMRMLLLELRPVALAQAPLADLLRQLTQSVAARAQIPVSLAIQGALDLPPAIRVAFYRVAQEALNNVVKHAKAGEAMLSIHADVSEEVDSACHTVLLHVCDDGCGFDLGQVTVDHLGLRIMRERAAAIGATLGVKSQPGAGTEIELFWQSAIPCERSQK